MVEKFSSLKFVHFPYYLNKNEIPLISLVPLFPFFCLSCHCNYNLQCCVRCELRLHTSCLPHINSVIKIEMEQKAVSVREMRKAHGCHTNEKYDIKNISIHFCYCLCAGRVLVLDFMQMHQLSQRKKQDERETK